jgi:hypothetical protein
VQVDVGLRIAQLAGDDPERRRRLERLAKVEEVDEWQVLEPHRLVDGRELSAENVRGLYLHLTDRLIHRVTAGAFDRVVFLDKSARPVAWLMMAAWELLALDFTANGGSNVPIGVTGQVSRPAITFLNIDRLQWRHILDPLGVGDFDAGRLDAEVIAGLRRSQLVSHRDRDLTGSALSDAPTRLDGQRVLVVDEVAVSGDTGRIAADMLRRAFPDSTCEAGHWMRPKLVTGADGNRRNNLLPVWYRDDTSLGRGVGDRDPEASSRSSSWRVRSGAWFLSCPHRPTSIDTQGALLRAELSRLAAGLLHGRHLFVPDLDRDDCNERSRWFNGIDLVAMRGWREQHGMIFDI